MENTTQVVGKHPCFSAEAHQTHGRIHLPVAPKCNIQCNYCNRKTDCVNESRPGVTSAVMTPRQGLEYLRRSLAHDPRISVAAIAGPGDSFATPEETLETLRLIRENYPEMVVCLSSNGLGISPYVEDLYDLGVRFVTLTINGTDPHILSQIYAWVRHNKKTYRGLDAGKLMLDRQMDALESLKSMGFTVKVNSVVLPGINDHHIPDLAKTLGDLHVDRLNCIPVMQNENAFFENIEIPTADFMADLQAKVAPYVKVMSHCQRCRSDAAGILGESDPVYQEIIKAVISPIGADGKAPRVAIGTEEGMFINQHLGECDTLTICEPSEEGYRVAGVRNTPPRGLGDDRWIQLADMLSDCGVLLVSGIGPRPLELLTAKGIQVVEMGGFVDEALDKLFAGEALQSSSCRASFKCGSSCGGNGQGCS